jgi:hypothetical protein
LVEDVFPQWNEGCVSSAHREAYVSYSDTKLPFNADIDALGTSFKFSPGEALHITFIAGQHVRNGSDDVSISMSIIFNTEQSMAWRRALRFNHSARRFLKPLGIAPFPIGKQAWRDATKAQLWDTFTKLRNLGGKHHGEFAKASA